MSSARLPASPSAAGGKFFANKLTRVTPRYYTDNYAAHMAGLDGGECEAVFAAFAAASTAAFRGDPFNRGGHAPFQTNQNVQGVLDVSPGQFRSDGRERRDHAANAMATSLRGKVAACFGGAALPGDATRVDERTVVLAHGGHFVHMWQSAAQAKLFISSGRALSNAIFELNLGLIRHPVSVAFTYGAATVTVTPLVPLPDTDAPAIDAAPLLRTETELLRDALDATHVPSVAAFKLTRGADARVYCLSAAWRTDNLPALSDPGNVLCKVAATALLRTFAAMGTVTVEHCAKTQVVAKTLHSAGVNMSDMYHTLVHVNAAKSDPAMVAAVSAAIEAEMVTRALKAIVRAEHDGLLLIPLQAMAEPATAALGFAFDEATGDGVEPSGVADLAACVNRLFRGLASRSSGFWTDAVLPIVRQKFNAPATYGFAQTPALVKLLVEYTTTRLGVVYDRAASAFTGCMPLTKGLALFDAVEPHAGAAATAATAASQAASLMAASADWMDVATGVVFQFGPAAALVSAVVRGRRLPANEQAVHDCRAARECCAAAPPSTAVGALRLWLAAIAGSGGADVVRPAEASATVAAVDAGLTQAAAADDVPYLARLLILTGIQTKSPETLLRGLQAFRCATWTHLGLVGDYFGTLMQFIAVTNAADDPANVALALRLGDRVVRAQDTKARRQQIVWSYKKVMAEVIARDSPAACAAVKDVCGAALQHNVDLFGLTNVATSSVNAQCVYIHAQAHRDELTGDEKRQLGEFREFASAMSTDRADQVRDLLRARGGEYNDTLCALLAILQHAGEDRAAQKALSHGNAVAAAAPASVSAALRLVTASLQSSAAGRLQRMVRHAANIGPQYLFRRLERCANAYVDGMYVIEGDARQAIERQMLEASNSMPAWEPPASGSPPAESGSAAPTRRSSCFALKKRRLSEHISAAAPTVHGGSGVGLSAAFFAAGGILLDRTADPPKLWGVRILHDVAMDEPRGVGRLPLLEHSSWVHGPLGSTIPWTHAAAHARRHTHRLPSIADVAEGLPRGRGATAADGAGARCDISAYSTLPFGARCRAAALAKYGSAQRDRGWPSTRLAALDAKPQPAVQRLQGSAGAQLHGRLLGRDARNQNAQPAASSHLAHHHAERGVLRPLPSRGSVPGVRLD
jgi:hypothetical protein